MNDADRKLAEEWLNTRTNYLIENSRLTEALRGPFGEALIAAHIAGLHQGREQAAQLVHPKSHSMYPEVLVVCRNLAAAIRKLNGDAE